MDFLGSVTSEMERKLDRLGLSRTCSALGLDANLCFPGDLRLRGGIRPELEVVPVQGNIFRERCGRGCVCTEEGWLSPRR